MVVVNRVCSILGARVVSTEQLSCLPYLRRNLELNPEIDVVADNLSWYSAINSASQQKFDIVIGCDITFEPKNFCHIIRLVKGNLKEGGIALICHDNDSCPLSKYAQQELFLVCNRLDLHIQNVEYGEKEVGSISFINPLVKIWQLTLAV